MLVDKIFTFPSHFSTIISSPRVCLYIRANKAASRANALVTIVAGPSPWSVSHLGQFTTYPRGLHSLIPVLFIQAPSTATLDDSFVSIRATCHRNCAPRNIRHHNAASAPPQSTHSFLYIFLSFALCEHYSKFASFGKCLNSGALSESTTC